MSGCIRASPDTRGEIPTSRFTYNELRLLSQSSPKSPLRVIALVDYDAFYAQCESVRLNLPPTQPLAVQQWNAIIALNYAARGHGFTRGAAVEDVKRLCPDIVLQHVATWREGEPSWAYRVDAVDQERMKRDKAALDPYRIESRKSLEIIKETLPPAPMQRIEKASVDEVFLDLSAHVYSILLSRYMELFSHDDLLHPLPLPPADTVLDWDSDNLVEDLDGIDTSRSLDWDDIALHIGAEIIRDLRGVILKRMKYTCSAGIAQNKALAKLAAGFKKPNQQTVVRPHAVDSFLTGYKVTSIRGLAGKLGAKAETAFGTNSIPELKKISMQSMNSALGAQDGTWLFNLIRGVEHSEVIPRTDPQSMLAQKTFSPPLAGPSEARFWLSMFAADLVGRLKDLSVETGCSWQPSTLALHHHIRGRFGPTRSKQCVLPKQRELEKELVASMAWKLLQAVTESPEPAWPCLSIGLSLHGLEKEAAGMQRITSFMLNTRDKRKREAGDGDDERSLGKLFDRSCQAEECGGIQLTASVQMAKQEVPDDSYTCPNCSSVVPAVTVLEHLDWHVAYDLQNQP